MIKETAVYCLLKEINTNETNDFIKNEKIDKNFSIKNNEKTIIISNLSDFKKNI